LCQPGERETCPEDCPSSAVCPNGVCEGFAERLLCPQDCGDSCEDPACGVGDLFRCPEQCPLPF
jgi:hypothetical protein